MRFYTLPPLEVPYPYVIINANRPEPGLRYIARHWAIIDSVIIDSGVEIFRDPKVREYPGGPARWIERLVALYRRVRAIVPGADVYVTVPDYPDDYHPRSLWLSEERTNIERTIDNILLALEFYPDIGWLIPIQGHYEDPKSIVAAMEKYEKAGILEWAAGNTHYIAIANLCVSKKCSTIARTLALAHNWLLQHGLRAKLRIHVFGPAASCVRRAKQYIDSWDSTAWTKPRSPGGSSAWNGVERVYLFLSFIHRYSDLVDLPPLPRSMRERLQQGVVS